MSKLEQGYVTGHVRWLLRLEGLAIFLFALMAYEFMGFQWGFFILVFLAPDLSFFAYFHSSRVGAIAYNTMHSYILPLMLFAYGFFVSSSNANQLAIIWIAHIGFDRALGFGVKYSKGFRYTHFGKLGHSKEN
ncbi:hypothetical protein GCM10011613_06350 [Cellvibrio zantedeschiae]|uniref:DUF4260 domain-containing protein n=1 Tax=Cellvibrio zantedeschiae TaxID=1237077 RepID=A0ABQ3ATA1_9GAMM|nr:DUF4260 domain-containing protein [Cellvibrio zantedeschiae]GGY65226.1 hypothetical protein GCM10011613_06350 [Cellvibrio zantedeschiae]